MDALNKKSLVALLGVLYLAPALWSASSPLPGISVSRTKLDPDLEAALFNAQSDSDIEALQALAQQHGYTVEVRA